MTETPIYDLKDISMEMEVSVRTLREYVKRGDLQSRSKDWHRRRIDI